MRWYYFASARCDSGSNGINAASSGVKSEQVYGVEFASRSASTEGSVSIRFGVERDVADFVDHDEAVAGDLAYFGVEAVGAGSFGQAVDPAGGRGERHPVPGGAAAIANAVAR